MRKFLVLTVLFITAICFNSCKKDVTNQPTTGSISGKISPYYAGVSIEAIKSSGGVTKNAVFDNVGNFSINGLEPGDYEIQFTVSSSYDPLASRHIIIHAGENVAIGTITLAPASYVSGSLSGRISPVGLKVIVVARLGGGSFGGDVNANGNFKVDNLRPGLYKVVLTPASLSYYATDSVDVNVVSGVNTDMGSITINPIAKKAIDTIRDNLFLTTAAEANDFVRRAALDSAIVFMNSFGVADEAFVPEMQAALNKVIKCRRALQLSTNSSAVLAINGLKEAGTLAFSGTSISNINLPELSVCGNLSFTNCPSITKVNLKPGVQLSGLVLANTALSGLTDFKFSVFESVNLDIRYNSKLTSLADLNFSSDSSGICIIVGNSALTNLDGLQQIKRFVGETDITDNSALQSLTGLNNATYAKRFTLSGNPQLTNICPAKVLLNYLKTAPDYTEREFDPVLGVYTYTTIHAFTASANGSYATKDALIAAAAGCP